ncbi:MAG: ATP-binding protein [Desulfarculaceae bacterium]
MGRLGYLESQHFGIHSLSLVGAIPRPGGVSLARHSVFFLDELSKFKMSMLELLSRPLESGQVTLTRSASTMLLSPASCL